MLPRNRNPYFHHRVVVQRGRAEVPVRTAISVLVRLDALILQNISSV
jgi:hypothetical protein